MKQPFEDRKRKPIKPITVTMAEYLNQQIVRVILAKKEPRKFQHA